MINNIYENFITHTEHILNQLEGLGYCLEEEKEGNIFFINKYEKYVDYKQLKDVDSVIKALHSHLYNNIPFEIVGVYPPEIIDPWIKFLYELKDNEEEIKKIYESCFRDIGIVYLSKIIPDEKYTLLLTILGCKHTQLLNTEENTEENIEDNMIKVNRIIEYLTKKQKEHYLYPYDMLKEAIKNLLINVQESMRNYKPAIGFFRMDEYIYENLKELFKEEVFEFLPLIPTLPQKEASKNYLFQQTNPIVEININKQEIHNKYLNIVTSNQLNTIIKYIVAMLNNITPGNIASVYHKEDYDMTVEKNKKSYELIFYSSNNEMINVDIIVSLLEKMFEIFNHEIIETRIEVIDFNKIQAMTLSGYYEMILNNKQDKQRHKI